jgi:uncharacterized membrane protein SirB2
MNWFALSLFIHLIGIGMIFTLLFAGPVIHANFKWENDLNLKRHSARLLRAVGLISPYGALVLILSGIGNMVAVQISFSDLFGKAYWLGVKLLLFAILLGLGMILSPKMARQRASLLEELGQANRSDDVDEKLSALNKKQTRFFVVNWILVSAISLLTFFNTR